MTEEKRSEFEELPEELPEGESIEELGTASIDELLLEEQAKPLTPATPVKEPPLFTPPTYVSARVDRDGFAMVEGERLFVGRSLAGARVNVEKRG